MCNIDIDNNFLLTSHLNLVEGNIKFPQYISMASQVATTLQFVLLTS